MTEEHEVLREQYQVEMREAMMTAQAWWRTQLEREINESPQAAEAELRRRWPDGPASHPVVIGTIQKYLRLCDELNRRVGQGESMDFNRMVIDGLDSRESRDVSRFTRALSYWPIGVTEDSELV
jgi:hypothetical protein